MNASSSHSDRCYLTHCVLTRRLHDIDATKCQPIYSQNANRPKTPDPIQNVSNRVWRKQIQDWRTNLIQSKIESETGEECTRRRRSKRDNAIRAVSHTSEYVQCSHITNAPDPSQSMSKRTWEKEVQRWRKDLKGNLPNNTEVTLDGTFGAWHTSPEDFLWHRYWYVYGLYQSWYEQNQLLNDAWTWYETECTDVAELPPLEWLGGPETP
jgi:hypothetical protein